MEPDRIELLQNWVWHTANDIKTYIDHDVDRMPNHHSYADLTEHELEKLWLKLCEARDILFRNPR